MFCVRRREAGSDTNVTLSTTGAEISVLVLMMSRIADTGAARTHTKALLYAPGHPNFALRMFQAIVPSTFGTERYVYCPLCKTAARNGGLLLTG
jgi:hypothetical protein